MKNFLKFSILFSLLLIAKLCSSSNSTMKKPLPPRKPTVQEELIIQSMEASFQEISYECSAFNEGSNHTDAESQENSRWRDGFYVQLDQSFTFEEEAVINSALYVLDNILCVGVFVWPQDSQPIGDFAFIEKDTTSSRCSSKVGKQGGLQRINLGERCMKKKTIIHECIHALGFPHEQSRPDRDNHVSIYWEHIKPGHEHNFEMSGLPTFDVPYDFESIMHYSSYAFSKDDRPTILKKDGGIIGHNQEVTTFDQLKVRKMYDCE